MLKHERSKQAGAVLEARQRDAEQRAIRRDQRHEGARPSSGPRRIARTVAAASVPRPRRQQEHERAQVLETERLESQWQVTYARPGSSVTVSSVAIDTTSQPRRGGSSARADNVRAGSPTTAC
jgi:hypothetical protein